MKFITGTKPLIDSLSLGVINSNVTKYFQKSTIAQVSANKSTLTINLEAAFIYTEIQLKGQGDEDANVSIFVDSLLLKQLVSTFEAATTTLEFGENGLTLYAGKSKFTLPKILSDVEASLQAPKHVTDESNATPISKADWKFVKENQMYALGMSFSLPVYTKVWVSEAGDVIVGDFDNSIFTHSMKGNLDKTCLLSDTIINLFNSLPEGAKLIAYDDSYIIHVVVDSYEYTSQFTPQYESDPDVGSYKADIIMSPMSRDLDAAVEFDATELNKFMTQSSLISSNSEDSIMLEVSNGELKLYDDNGDIKLAVKNGEGIEYRIELKKESIKSVLSKYGEHTMLRPTVDSDGDVGGVTIWNDDLVTALGGVEN